VLRGGGDNSFSQRERSTKEKGRHSEGRGSIIPSWENRKELNVIKGTPCRGLGLSDPGQSMRKEKDWRLSEESLN